jgi:hypothetical protein
VLSIAYLTDRLWELRKREVDTPGNMFTLELPRRPDIDHQRFIIIFEFACELLRRNLTVHMYQIAASG